MKETQSVEAQGSQTVLQLPFAAQEERPRASVGTDRAEQLKMSDAFLPSRAMCTDNAAMVGAAAWWRLAADGPSGLDLGANPSLRLPSG